MKLYWIFGCLLLLANSNSIGSERLVPRARTHTTRKSHVCKYCDASFRHLSALIDHERTHTGEKPFVCSICGRGFTQRGNLTTHERMHTGEKPYGCSVCDKYFKHKSSLIAHECIHTGERPYFCECGSDFRHASSLTRHRKICLRRSTNIVDLDDKFNPEVDDIAVSPYAVLEVGIYQKFKWNKGPSSKKVATKKRVREELRE